MAKRVSLPVLQVDERASSIAADGKRKFVYTADVSGRFHRLRWVVFTLLVAFWVAMPLVKVDGRPLVLLDIAARKFFLLGATFNSQDVWLGFFAVTAVGFSLALVTSLYGRVFCGFVCPQTVFLDGVFRPIERFFEGPRERRIRRDKGRWTAEKIARKAAKHAAYLLAAFVIAHITLSFFVPLPETIRRIGDAPSDHPEAFAWAASVTLLVYGNFAFFREQVCVVVCPYGRLQSVLLDDDTVSIGYDERRGEPRAKATEKNKGDCVDCKRCVVVCPTGIDIRNGLQLDCIGCTACVDACDEVMTKLNRPRGLVRYDSKRGFAGEARRFWRPRLLVYAALGALGLLVTGLAVRKHTSFEATLARASGAPFVIENDRVRNSYVLHLVNKRDEAVTYRFEARDAEFVGPSEVQVAPMDDARIPVVATVPLGAKTSQWTLIVSRVPDDERVEVRAGIARPAK